MKLLPEAVLAKLPGLIDRVRATTGDTQVIS